jgi:cellulose synthase/poly-beta-1,6-N-acetylglucosamine synthase-like glycosyltransferase
MFPSLDTVLALAALTCFGLVIYSYLIYPLLLLGLAGFAQVWVDAGYVRTRRDRRRGSRGHLPSVGVAVSAFNEEAHIGSRIENLLSLDYPAELLRIYVGSDGSSDGTEAIIRSFANDRVRCFAFAENRGKASVLNDLVAQVTESVVVFSDANSNFESDALLALVAPFSDPSVGCVSGELRLEKSGGDNQDSLYWRFEQFLKICEGRIGGLLGANGAIYAIRRCLWQPLRSDTVCDDFTVAMSVSAAGHRVVYKPDAVAREMAPSGIGEEYRRRVRIGIGNFQAMVRHPEYLFGTTGIVAFTYLSHKVLRWTAPHLLLVSAGISAVLAVDSFAWLAFAVFQLGCYGLAGAAFMIGERAGRLPALLRMPAFLFALNWAFLVASAKFAAGRYRAGWERTQR